jgi:hypothetical protein
MVPRVFRVSEIPPSWSTEDIREALQANNITAPSSTFRLLPSCVRQSTFTTIVALGAAAPSLARVIEDPLSSDLLPFRDHNLVVDQNFYGLTTLACPPSDSEIKAE